MQNDATDLSYHQLNENVLNFLWTLTFFTSIYSFNAISNCPNAVGLHVQTFEEAVACVWGNR